jgi:hypothetical protein
MEGQKIIDYKIVVRQVETDFWCNVLPEQKEFEKATKELLLKGYVPYDELKITSGSAGGFLGSSQYPTISQAFVKYGNVEDAVLVEPEPVKPEAIPLTDDELRKQRIDKTFRLGLVAFGICAYIYFLSDLL